MMIFDARCLDKDTRQELLRILPQLVHIRRAWRAEYMECGCTSCHKKKLGMELADSAMRVGGGFTCECGTGTGKPCKAAICPQS